MRKEVATEFPILLEPKKSINKILILYIKIEGINKEDYLKTIEWMNDIEFSLKLKTKNNNIEKNKTYKLIISKEDIQNFVNKQIEFNEREMII